MGNCDHLDEAVALNVDDAERKLVQQVSTVLAMYARPAIWRLGDAFHGKTQLP
jgi:hypothetical protein